MRKSDSSHSEFEKSLSTCSKTAEVAYKKVSENSVNLESILKGLLISLGKNYSEIMADKDAANFQFSVFVENYIHKIKDISKNGIEELNKSLEVKKRHLSDFTITFFGRTKAGKSTIREALTRNGDGSTIGLGAQHTTKEVSDYQWKGLRILDTPGIEGFGGNEEALKAHDVIDQSDLIVFLTTDESQQPGEFDEMNDLIEINKPFFVLLNVKDKLTEPAVLTRFLNQKGNLFNTDIISEHRNRIYSETKRLGITSIKFIYFSALAACISQFAERSKNKSLTDVKEFIKHPEYAKIVEWLINQHDPNVNGKLWYLSKVEILHQFLSEEINTRGSQRRILTLFDSLVNYLESIIKILSVNHKSVKAHARYLSDKRAGLKVFFDKYITNSNDRIKEHCHSLFNPLREWIPVFVEEYLGAPNANSIMRDHFKKEIDEIEKSMEGLLVEIVDELKKKLQEFTQEYNYDLKTIKFDLNDIGELKKGNFSGALKWLSTGAGAISGIASAIVLYSSEAAVTNFWNPVGWIAAGVAIVTGLFAFWFKKREENSWHQKKQDAKRSLQENVDSVEDKTIKIYKKWFYDNITQKGKADIYDQVSLYIKSLNSIAASTHNYSYKLMLLRNEINSELFIWLLKLEGIKLKKNAVLNVFREQGFCSKILVTDTFLVTDETQIKFKKLTGEYVHFIKDSDDKKELIKNAIYPANPSLDQINIFERDGKMYAEIKPNKDENTGHYFGKNYSNLRLACQLTETKIIIKTS